MSWNKMGVILDSVHNYKVYLTIGNIKQLIILSKLTLYLLFFYIEYIYIF